MQAIKNINNNVSLCIDSSGREVVAFGKGVGFIKPPQTIPLSKIERTFYNISEVDFEMIKNIPANIIKASIRIVDMVENNLNVVLIPTTTLALADHINFAIKRTKEFIYLDLAIQEDIKQIYQEEIKLAYKALEIIYEDTGILLNKRESGTIALHFINNQVDENGNQEKIKGDIIEESISIIEKKFDLNIDRESFNYSRFITHLHYLIRRTLKNSQIQSENKIILKKLIQEYPIAYQCTLKISSLFSDNLKITLNDEENLYLMLHINRLCSRDVQESKEI